MTLVLRSLALGALSLALAACQGEKKPAEGKTAQGEILPGSASDAMLPLDTVRSQPPLAPIEVATGKPGKAATHGEPDDAGSDAAKAEGEAPPAAAPSISAEAVQ